MPKSHTAFLAQIRKRGGGRPLVPIEELVPKRIAETVPAVVRRHWAHGKGGEFVYCCLKCPPLNSSWHSNTSALRQCPRHTQRNSAGASRYDRGAPARVPEPRTAFDLEPFNGRVLGRVLALKRRNE